MSGSRARVAIFVGLVAACVAVSVGYLAHADRRAPRVTAGVVDPATLESTRAGPHVVFRSLADGQAGLLAVAPLAPPGGAGVSPDVPGGRRLPLDLECVRVYFSAGRGLCLTDKGTLFTPYNIIFLGSDLQPYHTEALAGIISRARISPDGRYGAATAFVTGHSYAPGTFSTQTTLYEMETGDLIEDVEHFDVYQDGSRIESPDFNFWGVTFTQEPGEFYATLGTAGHTYLVRGDIETLRVDVLRDGVECPSISPDGTRIAFKQKVGSDGGSPRWRPAVLDLATLEDHPLAETRHIDDQIEWLDDDTVVYAVEAAGGPPDTWAAPADGSGEPRLLLTDAESPAVVRG